MKKIDGESTAYEIEEPSEAYEIEEPSDKKVASDRNAIKKLMMPEYFRKHEFHIRMVFIKHLNQVAGIRISKEATWEEIESTLKVIYDLPEISALSNCEAAKREIVAQFGFPYFNTMIQCIEMGKNLEKEKLSH